MTILTMLLPVPNLHCTGPLALWGISQHLPAKYRRRPTKVLPSERGAPGTVPHGKSGPGYRITFIKGYIGPEVATFRTKTRNRFHVKHLIIGWQN